MARPVELNTTLGELLGQGRQLLTLEDLPDVLGEKMPEMQYDRVGKMRLQKALQNRFGVNYRSIPGVSDLIKEFDEEVKMQDIINMGDSNGVFS